MRIQRIRLQGFKSFAKKTELVLDPGITAIVGPNGCGKSNVIDAVKWVLGEQRPTSLRAKEMMDLIFAGSGKRKPVGMAEVNLILDNEDQSIEVDRSEVVLTRRLYRSGESEYRLNGVACRLRDLRETLMDTGSGLDAFSIMEQGRIDAILTANPVERRAVFEEAAGIGRFKARRKETLRRLERVGDDLTRLRDVIEITEKQLRSLRYQASRANRYRDLSEKVRRKRTTWALYRYHALLGDREEVSGRLAELGEKESRLNLDLQALVSGLSDEETGFEKLASQMREAEAALLTLDAEIRSSRERGEHGRRLAAELADRVEWYDSEIKVTERRIEEMEKEISERGEELAALGAEVALREAELRNAEETIREARSAEAERDAGLAGLRKRRVTRMEERSSVRNQRAYLKSRLKSGEGSENKILRRLHQLATDREGLTGRAAELSELVAQRVGEEREIADRLVRAEEEGQTLEERLESLSEQAAASDRKLSAARSRLELLESMKARREGMDHPVQKLLEEAGRAETALPGIKGVVADLLQVEEADAEAVELALGACAQAIVTETAQDAVRAIGWLKEQRLGRALFVPLDEVREAGPVYGGQGAARPVLASVRTEPGYEVLVRALLSDSVVVEDFENARRMAHNGGRQLRIVTGGGEVLNRIGAVSGGRGRAPAALISRNAEIESLSASIVEEEERREALGELLSGLKKTHSDGKSEIRVLREELLIASRGARSAEGEHSRVTGDLKRIAEEEHVLTVERGELAEEREGAANEDLVLEKKESEIRLAEEALAIETRELEAALGEARERSQRAAEQQMEVRVALARAKERLGSAETRVVQLERGVVDARRSVELARVEMENCGRRRDEARLDSEVADREAEEGGTAKRKSVAEVATLRKRHEEARERILSRRRETDSLREGHEQYRAALEKFRLKESENRLMIEGLVDRVSEDFDLDLVDLYEGFTPEEVDWEALDREVGELKQKIDRMGNVNLEALDQLTEVQEQVDFLHKEEADLTKSRDSLQDILRKVNRESRERFEQAFSAIRGNFREMFRKLFGGGTAEIRLEEGQDILEAGIEIVVRPPGREPQILNLLSGGEKTLTAVALLFSIFKSRPSPFALMDEVDAALDESNIDRFLAVLREFADESQFVIITHNKRTMAFADTLYGVSMPEPGISEPVSIRFAKEEADGNGRAGAKAKEEAAPASR